MDNGLIYMIQKSIFYLCFIGTTLFLSGCVSVKDFSIYSVSGIFEKQTAQGFAVWEHYAFLFNNQGWCRIFDLKQKKIINKFQLGSFHKNNHANCASFGVEFPMDNNAFPALYISECNFPYRCFVEDITDKKSTLIQTIQYVKNGEIQKVSNWITDRRMKKIYAVARCNKNMKDSVLILRSRLPSINEGDVIFEEKDVEDSFYVTFPNLLQGGTIHAHCLYLPVGLHTGNESRKDAERAILVVDIGAKKIVDFISLQDKIVNEPEDVDFYDNHLLLFCGQTGGIYPIYIK